MTLTLINELEAKGVECVVVFANTGLEDWRTLEFIHKCDFHYGLKTIWLEPVVHHGVRKGCTHKVVNYATALGENDQLMESVIKKYGIPNMGFPHCTRELKLNPMRSYLKSISFTGKDTMTLIGIRSDEADRMNKDFEKNRYWYPLVDMGVTKQDVLKWWKERPFDLEVPEHRGNCVWCWKKSYRKLCTLYKENPEIFDQPKRLEKLYKNQRPERGGQSFFRKGLDTGAIIKMAKEGNFKIFEDPNYENSCKESCEPL